jgi:hypothetical protein
MPLIEKIITRAKYGIRLDHATLASLVSNDASGAQISSAIHGPQRLANVRNRRNQVLVKCAPEIWERIHPEQLEEK